MSSSDSLQKHRSSDSLHRLAAIRCIVLPPTLGASCSQPSMASSASASSYVADPEILARLADPTQHGGLMTNYRWIMKRLEDQGLVTEQNFLVDHLGPHPFNRSSYGVNEESVHNLGQDIADLGWDFSELGEVRDRLAAEDDPSDAYIERHNIDLTKNSEFLAPCKPGTLKAGVLTNNHTVLLCRAAKAGVPTKVASLAVNGHMSLPHIGKRDPEFVRACEDGWRWTVLHWRTKHLYGKALFEFLADVKNITVQRSETEIQVLLKIFNTANAFEAKGQAIDWSIVSQVAVRTKPPCASYVPSLIAFVRLYGSFVAEFAKFHGRFVPNERFVAGAFYEAVTNFVVKDKSGKPQKTPLLRYAALKMEYLSPIDKIVCNECRMTTKADIDGAMRKRPEEALKAESILSQSREMLENLGAKVTADDRLKLFAKLDVSVARVLFNKQKGSAHTYSNIEAVASDFMNALAEIVGTECPPNPWKEHDARATEPSSAHPTVPVDNKIQRFTTDGKFVPEDIVAELKRCGFEVGSTIFHRSEKEKQLTLKNVIAEDSTVVVENASKETTSVLLSKFVKEYSIYEEEHFPTGVGHTSTSNEAVLFAVAKGQVLWSLQSVSTLSTSSIRLQVKPRKKVIAEKAHKVGALIVVAETTRVDIVLPKQKPPAGGVSVGHMIESMPEAEFFLAPPTMSTTPSKKTLNSGFWCVTKTTDPDEANMVLSTIAVEASVKSKGKPDLASNFGCDVPVLKNSKAIAIGEELKVLDWSAQQTENTPAPKKAAKAQPTKRRRT